MRRIFKRYKTRKRGGQHYHVKSLENIVNFSSSPVPVIERLGRDRHKALMRKGDVHRFFDKYPEYEKEAKDISSIKLLKDRRESIKKNRDAETSPGMYLPIEKEIRLFPIKPPKNLISKNEQERYDILYTRENFPEALAHEIRHHSERPEELNKLDKMSDDEVRDILRTDSPRIQKLLNDDEINARKAEPEWIEKMKKRKGVIL